MPAVIRPELVAPGVAAERMFVKGQRVSGLHDVSSNRLDVSAQVAPATQALAHVAVGAVILARVSAVGPDGARLTVLPGVDVTVTMEDLGAGAEVDPRELATVGEVLPVEVMSRTDGPPDRLSILDQELTELAQSVAIFADGPAWLVPEVPESAEQEARIERLEADLAAARTATRDAGQQARTAAKEVDAARSQRARATTGLFGDPAEQFRHEVYVARAERTTADDKRRHPWRGFTLGPDFLATLGELEGVDRAKVVEVASDIVCGRADGITARAVHQLRTGGGPHDPLVTRPSGGTCWRVSLQHKTPAARRLHFWRLSDGTVELASVRVHDDMRP